MTEFRPLPPGVRTENIEVRMRSIPCPQCKTILYARDLEKLEDGYRLVCDCGLDFLEIHEKCDESNF